MTKKYLRKQKGFMISDAIIACLVILLFSGIILSLIYNIVLEITRLKNNSQQLDIATNIFEYIEKSKYSEVEINNIREFLNNKYGVNKVSIGEDISSLTNPYKVAISITPYNNIEGNEDEYPIIKIVNINIQSELAGKTYSTEMSTLKKATEEEVKAIIGE